MIVVDKLVLARMRVPDGLGHKLNVHEGEPVAHKDPLHPVEVDLPFPYVTYHSAIGDDDNPRLSARAMRRSVPFYLMYVGITEEQAKAAGQRARELLQRWRPPTSAAIRQAWPCKLEESQRVRRDDAAVQVGGGALYYGVDAYAVSIMLAAEPAGV